VRKYPKYRIRLYPFGNRISVYIRIYTAKYPPKYRIPQNTLIPLREPYFRIYTVYIPQNTPQNTVCVSSYLVAGIGCWQGGAHLCCRRWWAMFNVYGTSIIWWYRIWYRTVYSIYTKYSIYRKIPVYVIPLQEPYFGIYTVYMPQNTPKNTNTAKHRI